MRVPLGFLVALSCYSTAQAQTATLLDGRVLTQVQPVEAFATEGPIWNLDVPTQQIFVVGKAVTIPLTVNGLPFSILGSSVGGQDGTAATGIGAANFARLLDSAAITTDRVLAPVGTNLGPARLGPARSIFSTSEGRRTSVTTGLVRSAAAQTSIEQNYFNMVQSTYAAHAAALPADFLDRAGLRGTGSESWVYPTTAGGTLKSEGTVYSDAAGNRFFIPDVEAVIELSENVTLGPISSIARGAGSVPDSFVVGEMLVIFNQDPRFGADVLGVGLTPIPRDVFFAQAALGTQVAVIGHLVGEHVMFAQEIEVDMVDATAGVQITIERARFQAPNLRFRGVLVQPTGITLTAIVQGARFPVPFVIDPLTGGGAFDTRFAVPAPATFTEYTLEATNAQGVVMATETFPRP
jgi:hypothetical protein